MRGDTFKSPVLRPISTAGLRLGTELIRKSGCSWCSQGCHHWWPLLRYITKRGPRNSNPSLASWATRAWLKIGKPEIEGNLVPLQDPNLCSTLSVWLLWGPSPIASLIPQPPTPKAPPGGFQWVPNSLSWFNTIQLACFSVAGQNSCSGFGSVSGKLAGGAPGSAGGAGQAAAGGSLGSGFKKPSLKQLPQTPRLKKTTLANLGMERKVLITCNFATFQTNFYPKLGPKKSASVLSSTAILFTQPSRDAPTAVQVTSKVFAIARPPKSLVLSSLSRLSHPDLWVHLLPVNHSFSWAFFVGIPIVLVSDSLQFIKYFVKRHIPNRSSPSKIVISGPSSLSAQPMIRAGPL